MSEATDLLEQLEMLNSVTEGGDVIRFKVGKEYKGTSSVPVKISKRNDKSIWYDSMGMGGSTVTDRAKLVVYQGVESFISKGKVQFSADGPSI